MGKYFVNLILIPVYILFAGIFLSCGLEENYYLESVPQIRITRVKNNSATINLPSLTQSYATHYSIFYRIYISDKNIDSEIQNSDAELGGINPSLLNDYGNILPYTDPTNTSSVNADIGNLFRVRSYNELELDEADIKTKLSKNGGTVVIDFPPNNVPTLTRNGESPIRLYRSTGGGDFTPQPDRLFFNSDDINNNNKAINTINADVAPNTTAGQPRYTYVSMYIVTVGSNLQEFNQIYSKPTYISIFKLPDKNY